MAADSPTFSDADASAPASAPASDWPDTGGRPVADQDINPRTGKPYTMSAEERKRIGQRLAEARRRAAAARGAKPGSRNPLTGKSTRATSAPRRRPAKQDSDDPYVKARAGAERICGWLALGGAFVAARDPVRAHIVSHQAETLYPVLVGLADNNERVRAALVSVATVAGPAGAWQDAAVWAGSTVGALALTLPRVPRSGPVALVASLLGGAVLDTAIERAATSIATDPATGDIDRGRLAQVRAQIAGAYGRPAPQQETTDDSYRGI